MSQLQLACAAEISQKHLSFVESGRSAPSRAMVLRLADQLRVPPRERNQWLLAAGFAPCLVERSLDDPALQPARRAVELILQGHEPYPALAVDRHWNMLAHNAAVPRLIGQIQEGWLLEPPVNVLRLSLHPGGLQKRILNLGQWRHHLFRRLQLQIEASSDVELVKLLNELRTYGGQGGGGEGANDLFVPLVLDSPSGPLRFISTTTVFGTPVDITLSELALETFFPADEGTSRFLRG